LVVAQIVSRILQSRHRCAHSTVSYSLLHGGAMRQPAPGRNPGPTPLLNVLRLPASNDVKIPFTLSLPPMRGRLLEEEE